jgi:hypothetical protein
LEDAGQKYSQLDEILLRHQGLLRSLHETIFSLNVGYAFGYALLIYISKNLFSLTSTTDLGYFFLRGAVRINNLLHLSSSIADLGWYPNPGSQVGAEVAFVVTLVGVALLVLFFLRLIAGPSTGRVVLGSVAGVTSLLTLPAFYLCALKLTWMAGPLADSTPFWQSLPPVIFAVELPCIGLVFWAGRKLSIPPVTTVTLFLLHYGLWTWVLWPTLYVYVQQRLFTPNVLLLIFPLSGIVWLLHRRGTHLNRPENSVTWNIGWNVTLAVAAVAALLIVWLPGKSYELFQPTDVKSLVIKMSRTSCRGSCPVYTITIHGDRHVDYVGQRFVKVRGAQTTIISDDQVGRLLRGFDQVRFFALEDRAFAWCFDTPRVSVGISVDGRSKEVSSDASCTGANRGAQAQFVRVASEIDTIVSSDQWVKCDGWCRE